MHFNKTLATELSNFAEYHPAGRVKTNLQRLMMGYLQTLEDFTPNYHRELVSDLEGLFELMDTLEKIAPTQRSLVGAFN